MFTNKQPKNKLSEYLAPDSFNITPSYIQVGNKFVRTIFLATYPRYLQTSWFSPVINLDKVFDVSIFILPQNTATVLKQLRDQLTRLEAQTIEESSKGKVRDPILETAIQDIEILRDRLQQGTDKFFEIGVYITIYENSIKELDEAENKLRSILEYRLIFAKAATFRMLEGFTSTMPFNEDRINVHTSLNTEPLSSIFPFVSFNLTSDNGILYGINTYNNSLVLFDRFQMENYNAVVFGKSGGGKSYTIKLEILRSLIFGAQVIVIDPEDEYKYLAETVGGTIIKISVTSDQHINPFDLKTPKPDESSTDIFRSHILDLTGLLRLMLGDITPEESAILDEALIQTYAVKDITPESNFTDTTPPVLSDLQNILDGLTGAESMAVRLKKYTSGTFSGFLNMPTNVSLDNNLIVFSIRDIEEELRPVAMYSVLNYIWTSARRTQKKRLLIVDEAWWLMKYDIGGDFLFNIAKRARKYYLGLVTISQDVPDFLSSPKGKAIITNSSMQILMKQSPTAIEVVQQAFNLTDAEKYYLLEARVGLGLLFVDQDHIGIRVVSSYAEDQIITSDPRQIIEIEKAKEEWAKLRS